jgi:sec-independent protein translocase protein TatA
MIAAQNIKSNKRLKALCLTLCEPGDRIAPSDSTRKEYNMGPLGMPELLIIALIIIILFGARRIPELAKGLGEGIRNFKTGMRGDDPPREIDDRKYRDEPERREEPRTSI